jgi:hypothetical protein
VDVGEPPALQASQFGDAAWHDVVLAHRVERAAVDFPLPQGIGADQEPDACSLEGVDASGEFLVLHGGLEQSQPVAEAHHANLDVCLAHGVDVVPQVAEQALEVGGSVGAAAMVDHLLVGVVPGLRVRAGVGGHHAEGCEKDRGRQAPKDRRHPALRRR